MDLEKFKYRLYQFIESTRGDNLYDQLIPTLEIQDLRTRMITVFLDIDTTLMAYQNSKLIRSFTKNFYDWYEFIQDIVKRIVEERIKDYSDSEELKKLAMFHLKTLVLHIELKISHFPIVYENISARLLSVNDELRVYGHLASVKKVSVVKVYDPSYLLMSRKFRPSWLCDPEQKVVDWINKNPMQMLKNSGFFNQLPTGSNFHYKYINDKDAEICQKWGDKYFYRNCDDNYIECRIAEGVAIENKKTVKNVEFDKIIMWFQSPFLDFLKEGQVVTITGYFFMIPNFHMNKLNGRVTYPLKVGCAVFNMWPIIDGEIDIAIMDEIEWWSTSILDSDINLKELQNRQTQQSLLMYKENKYK